jgi:hypothetical protein
MKRILMSILAVGTAVALSTAPAFAGGKVLSDGDLDTVTASNYNHESPDLLVGGSGGGVQNNDESQKDLMALNNVNASQSNVANQTNLVYTTDSTGVLILKQSNKASFSGDNGDNSGEAAVGSMGYSRHSRHSQSDDDVMLGGAGGGVQNNDESQKWLDAVNNVNASQSNVADQTNILSIGKSHSRHGRHGSSGPQYFALIKQSNKARFSGDNGSNKTSDTYIKDPKNKDDLFVANSGGGVQNNNEAQKNLQALNNVNASQSNVANQTNIAVGQIMAWKTIIKQSNSARFSGDNGGNSTGSYHHHGGGYGQD